MIKSDSDSSVLMSAEGYTDDLLNISDEGTMVGTRFFLNIGEENGCDDEVIDISIVSTSMNGKHPLFDKLREKKVRIEIHQI